MARVRGTILIRRPVEEVFDFVADERHEPRFNPKFQTVEMLTAAPIGVGTQFRALTTAGGSLAAMTISYTDFDRPRRLASTTHLDAMEIEGALTFAPDGSGTRLSWDWEIRSRGWLRFLGPLVAWIGRREEAAIWRALKQLLESEAPSPGPTSGSAGR